MCWYQQFLTHIDALTRLGVLDFRFLLNFLYTKNTSHLADNFDLQSISVVVLSFNQREYQSFDILHVNSKLVNLMLFYPSMVLTFHLHVLICMYSKYNHSFLARVFLVNAGDLHDLLSRLLNTLNSLEIFFCPGAWFQRW